MAIELWVALLPFWPRLHWKCALQYVPGSATEKRIWTLYCGDAEVWRLEHYEPDARPSIWPPLPKDLFAAIQSARQAQSPDLFALLLEARRLRPIRPGER